ncbi:MAG TPA: hypothetical protein VEZ40_10400 [Pyrinomonadaceae bacterium]|nr:hypothetical protein [Pyrinomonadaceae bacterium]
MRRKFGILCLVGITLLAGTQEAAQQFDGLKSSLKNFTRASLWSGLIVYAQPVSDGKLPTPQIYYLMPSPQQPSVAPAAQQPLLADNGNGATTTKPEARNNHGAQTAAVNPEAATLAATREIEDAAKSELALNALPLNLVAAHFVAPKVAPKPEPTRIYEEVAKHEPFTARKFKAEADALAKMFVKELDAAKIVAETERIVAVQEQLERLKSKTLGEAETLHRRMELRVVRRAAPRLERPERPERIRMIAPFVVTRGMALPDMSSIGCEKTRTKPEAAPPVPPTAPVAKMNAQVSGDAAVELELPIATSATGNTWTLNCDTEPEQK